MPSPEVKDDYDAKNRCGSDPPPSPLPTWDGAHIEIKIGDSKKQLGKVGNPQSHKHQTVKHRSCFAKQPLLKAGKCASDAQIILMLAAHLPGLDGERCSL